MLLRWWNGLSFQTKLLCAIYMLCVIPTASVGLIAYRQSADSLEKRVNEDLQVIIGQFNNTLEKQVQDFERYSMLPYSTEEIFEIIASPFSPRDQWGYRELINQQRLIQLITTYPSVNSMIEGMLFYGTNGSIYGYRTSGDKSINPDYKPYEEAWYKQAIDREGGLVISGLRDEAQFNGTTFKTITIARQLIDRDFKPAAVVAVDIKPAFIQKTVRSLSFKNVHVTVAAPDGYVYSSEPEITEKLLEFRSSQAETGEKAGGVSKYAKVRSVAAGGSESANAFRLQSTVDGNHRSWNGVEKFNEYTGWTTYLLVDREELLQESAAIKKLTLLVVLFIFIGAAVVSWLLAKGLSKPIRSLMRSMSKVEMGNFESTLSLPYERRDEIGQLQFRYNRMVTHLDELVNSIEESEKQKRNAELYALRARINPHFLYNTINSIRMLALIQQSEHIAKLLQSLSKLLHSNMKMVKDLVSLGEELELLKEYTLLMELRYTNRFVVRWKVSDAALKAQMPVMLLQPLLENAIFHGPSSMERQLRIEVSAEIADEGRTLRIVVADDGKGIDAAKVKELNDPAADGEESIGVRNVRERIRLRYGAAYGLTIDSAPGEGTKAILLLPYQPRGENADVEHAGR
ncbi:histidine kinase [Cohnella sp. LGH]|uniref:cache domain-containing sensor histidine kinase n=1 Tax=Cohnella sp. LGH TaxID=1619153 RepID=UPI001ADD2FEA|nr:sensor histidine kinase [Cohnella sp. LGH]QTH40925.1 histidine kinase [Cohnella sp. LGH]